MTEARTMTALKGAQVDCKGVKGLDRVQLASTVGSWVNAMVKIQKPEYQNGAIAFPVPDAKLASPALQKRGSHGQL